MEPVENLLLNKSKVRSRFTRLRDKFVQSQRGELPRVHFHIGRFLRQLTLQLPKGAWIASYKEKGSEVPTRHFESLSSKVHWLYPRVKGNQLQFLQPRGFIKSSWGIDEPTEDSPQVSLDQISMILLPGVAFDRRGHRLGTGRGFYDRSLASYQGLKVGIAYALQVSLEDFEVGEYDLPMEYIVTENYVLKQLKRL